MSFQAFKNIYVCIQISFRRETAAFLLCEEVTLLNTGPRCNGTSTGEFIFHSHTTVQGPFSRLGSGWGPRTTLSAFSQDLRPELCLTSAACSSKAILLLTFCCRVRISHKAHQSVGVLGARMGGGTIDFCAQEEHTLIVSMPHCTHQFCSFVICWGFFSHRPSTW